ncbi:MAG: 30S ribosomal protein S3 [Candidatus Thermoplasmatota archaeon]
MASERKFIRENTKRALIKNFLVKEIEGAGFGGMTIQRTPIGTRVNILVERPGMVIGKGGSKIKQLTSTIQTKFDVENPQIEIQEAGAQAALNAQIMAEKLAEALQRGWHFRRAGHSTVRRIMNAGAKGCQIVIAGKLTGARHRTEKFTEGHVKYCGEVAKEVMDNGFASAKLKAGVLGVKVRIMKPDAKLPDEVKLRIPEKKEEKTEEKKKEKTADKKEQKKTDIKKIAEIPGIGASVVKKLEKAKIGSLEELYEMDIKGILSIEGIGKKTAETIIKNLKKLIGEGT